MESIDENCLASKGRPNARSLEEFSRDLGPGEDALGDALGYIGISLSGWHDGLAHF